MKLKAHNIAVLLFLIAPIYSWAKDVATASKHYEERFSISQGGELDLDADFSGFEIEIWDKNEVFISGDVNIEAGSQKKADKLVESFTVNMSKSGNTVKCEVSLGGDNTWNSNGSTEMDVEFVIKAPSWILVNANISFGKLDFSALTNANIDMEYGSLKAGAFEGNNNNLNSSFGSASIDTFSGGKVDNAYGEVSIGTLDGNAEVENSYGELNIQSLSASVKNLDVENSFGETNINIPSLLTYDIDSESSFGEVKIKGKWNERSQESDFQDEDKKGTLGTGTSNGTIEVECSFGEVKIDQN
ncbi:MAG: DUF4097 family beta strand repeat-containing protein [Flavobacteriales bacterium]